MAANERPASQPTVTVQKRRRAQSLDDFVRPLREMPKLVRRAANGDRYIRVRPCALILILALVLTWCIGTTALVLRLYHSMETMQELVQNSDDVQNAAQTYAIVEKWKSAGRGVKRQLQRLPMLSAIYVLLSPHLSMMARHLGPLKFIGGQIKVALKVAGPMLQGVKPLLVLVEIRQKMRVFFEQRARSVSDLAMPMAKP